MASQLLKTIMTMTFIMTMRPFYLWPAMIYSLLVMSSPASGCGAMTAARFARGVLASLAGLALCAEREGQRGVGSRWRAR